MSFERIDDINDPRLVDYRDLRNKFHLHGTGKFIAEGWRVVVRLLESEVETVSILLSERRLETMLPKFAGQVPIFVLPEKLAQQLVGYNFHAGVLAAGKRPKNPNLSNLATSQGGSTIVCCPYLTSPDNLGSLIRLSAGFGVTGILLGNGSVEPYLRRCIRVSMGTIFQLPIRTAVDLKAELKQLKEVKRFRILAAETGPDSLPLQQFQPANSVNQIILFGNEAEGLSAEWLELADELYHIPMADGVDSLNITHAAGIFLYVMTNPVIY